VNKYRFLLMFQNDERIRSGKFYHPTVADISVQWLLQAYLSSMQRDGKNLYVFPVSINYERLFEIDNIADMMVSKNQRNLGLLDIKSKIDKQKQHRLGRTYVMFGKTISLRDYFMETEKGVLTTQNINNAALNLTQRLVIEAHLASPVFLNNVVASLLLHRDGEVYPLRELIRDCQTLYRYFNVRDISTIMT